MTKSFLPINRRARRREVAIACARATSHAAEGSGWRARRLIVLCISNPNPSLVRDM